MQIIVKTLQGLEPALAQEMRAHGFQEVIEGHRMVSFEGELEDLYKANLCLYTALRVIVPIDDFIAENEQDLYNKVTEMEWENLFGLRDTFAIDAITSGETFTHSKYVALKTKDAIVDRFYKVFDKRPNVHVSDPDFRIVVHIRNLHVTLSLDSSGSSLHMRGYRVHQVEAPVNEVLAAGMLILADWNGETDFLDPMCGSGTIAIEAAKMAARMPAQPFTRRYLFERWGNFDASLLQKVKSEAKSKIIEPNVKILAADKSMRNIRAAELNAAEAGVQDMITFARKDFFKSDLTAPLMVFNPPYDVRLTEKDIVGFYIEIGNTLKRMHTESSAWVISGNPDAIKRVGLRPSAKFKLFNGPIESAYHRFDMYEGAKV